jgi:hypothetical protein
MTSYPISHFVSDEVRPTLSHLDRQQIRRGVNVINESLHRLQSKPVAHQVLRDWVDDLTNRADSDTVTTDNIIYWVIAIGYSTTRRITGEITALVERLGLDESSDIREGAMQFYDVLSNEYYRALLERAHTNQQIARRQLHDVRANMHLIAKALKHEIETVHLTDDSTVDITIESLYPAKMVITVTSILREDTIETTRTIFVGTGTISDVAKTIADAHEDDINEYFCRLDERFNDN